MAVAQIIQLTGLGTAGRPSIPLGVVEGSGLALTNVSTSGTAANTNLADGVVAVTILAPAAGAIQYDIGVGVTAVAGASGSALLPAGGERTHALPAHQTGQTWRVSIIDAS